MTNKDVIAELQAKIDSIALRGAGTTAQEESGSSAIFEDTTRRDDEDIFSQGVIDERHRDSNAALKKIAAIVNASDKSELSIRRRLSSEGFDDQAIDESVSLAKDFGFIDDRRFAEVLVRSRLSQLRGSEGIIRELSENGIDIEIVEGWPYEYPVSHDEEIDRAVSLLKRKPPHSKNQREAAYRRLMQKGYPSSVCSSAARMWSEGSR